MVGYDKDQKILSNAEYILAGSMSGIITRSLCQPLDVIKIKFQLQVEPIKKTSHISKYKAFNQSIAVIVREEGLKGLWAGHNAGQLLSVTYGIIYFGAFELLTSKFSDEKNPFSHFICGSIAGGLATTISFPFDVIRTRFVAQGYLKNSKQTYQSMFHGLNILIKTEGPLAMFKGLTPSLVQGAPFAGISFLVHNLTSKIALKSKYLSEANSLNIYGNMVVGSFSGLVAKTSVYPFDLIRKRIQLQGFQNARKGFGENIFCNGILSCASVTMKKEGFLGFFKGLAPSLVKAGITTGLHFTVYEETCKILRQMHA